MPSLLGATITHTCERCGRGFPFEVWSVVDTDERPDLAARVMDASIRVFRCPACGHQVSSTDPLLVYRPRQGGLGAMVLGTSAPDDAAAVQEDGGALARWVAAQLGRDAREIGVIPAAWRRLPALMQRDVARDIETPDALLALPPELGAWYRSVLAQLRADQGMSWVTDLADTDLPDVDLVEHVSIPACPHCGAASTATVPCIVTDRPGLAARIRTGELFAHRCPQCGSDLTIGVVFLVWRPRRSPRVLLGAVRGMARDGAEERMAQLFEALEREVGDRFRAEWWDQMVVLPHDDLAERLAAGT